MFETKIIDISEINQLPENLKILIYKNNYIKEIYSTETQKNEIKLIVNDRFTMDLINKANNLNMKFLGKTREDYSLYILECGHFKEIKRSNFKNNSFECKECIIDRWKAEAKNVNLEYISYIDENRSLYKFLKGEKCDKEHTQIIGRKEVKNNNFKCNKCYTENLKEIAQKKNMEFIEVVREHYAIYKLECGHYKLKHMKNLSREIDNKKKEVCEVCRENLLRNKSEKKGFKLLNIPKGKRKDITLICNDCNSIHIINEDKLDTYICSNCEELLYQNDIDKLGLKLIRRIDKYKRLYKIKQCDHYQIIQNAQILRKRQELKNDINTKFSCTKCRDKELNEKLKEESSDAGVTLLVKIDKDNGFYIIDDCGHKQSIGIKEVRNKSFKCKTCKSRYLLDGITEVKSNYEKVTGNYLISQKYDFIYEKLLSDKRKYTCDFYISNFDLYIEVAGFLKNEQDKGSSEKVRDNGKSISTKRYYNNLKNKIDTYYKDKKLLILYKEDFIGDLWKDKLNFTLK